MSASSYPSRNRHDDAWYAERVRVETLYEGDEVRAVYGGPVGVVQSRRTNWTVVQYPGGRRSYETRDLLHLEA